MPTAFAHVAASVGGWPVSAPFKMVWTLWEGLMWAAFAVSYLAVADLPPRFLAQGLRVVGMVSYSIYLWHFPILSVVANKGWTLPLVTSSQHNAFWNTLLFALPVIVAFSALSYYVIERPFLARRVRYLTPSPEPKST